MHLFKTTILTLAAALISTVAAAQVTFDNVRHEFGTMLWHAPGTATFRIINKGKKPLLIHDVRPDCGCTAADWTRTPIAPGKEGTITATYDAELLGRFEKQLAVSTNMSDRPYYLTLSGNVALELSGGADRFPYRVGDFCLETDNVEFDDVRRGDMPEKTMLIYNAGRQSLKPELMHLPAYLSVTAEPETLRPGRTGRLTFRLNSDKLRTYGLTQTNVYVSRFAGDRVNRDNEVYVSATLLPEVEYDAATLAAAPVATLDSTTLHLSLEAGQKRVRRDVTLTNTGRSPLVVSAVQVYNPGLGVSLSKRTLKAGETARLRVTASADTEGFKGRRRVLLITNDPSNPKIIIDVLIKK